MADQWDKVKRLLPLTEASYAILISLWEPMHGYGIMQNVAAVSEGGIRIGPGTLYGALTKFLEQGLIERAGDHEAGGERRKLYVLTDLGRALVKLECDRLERLAKLGRRIMETAGGAA